MRDGKAYGIWLWLAAVAVTLAVCTTSYEIQKAIPLALRGLRFVAAMALPPVMVVLLLVTGAGAWGMGRKARAALFTVLAIVVAWYGLTFFFQQLLVTIDRAKCDAAEGDLTVGFGRALQLYRTDVTSGVYPATLLQLYSDNAPGWSGPYLATITTDPWDNQYMYTTDGASYTLQTVHGRDELYRDYTPGTIRLMSGSDTPERIP